MSDNGSFSDKKIALVLILMLLLFVIVITLLSLVPPISKDALVHHLAVPKLYLNHGGIYEIPFMDFSYYPMNLQLLYMIPLYFGNDIVPKFIHFGFAILTAWLIYYYLKRRTNTFYALLGSLFFLSLPIIIKLSITVYVDLGEIFFSLAALLFLMEWLKSDFKIKYLIYSGIMCGLALGTKYNGLVTLAVLTFFVPFLYSRYGVKKGLVFFRPVAYCVTFLFVSLLIFSPWMIRNYHWKSNPIYPLYDELFNPPESLTEDPDLKRETVKINQGFFTYRSLIYNEKGWQIALLPIRIFFQGEDGNPQYFDGKLNPFLFILPFFAFFRLRDDTKCLRREKKILLAYSVLFFCFAFFSTVLRIRYISPIIPPLIILYVFGIMNIFRIVASISSRVIRKLVKPFVIIAIFYSLVLNGLYIIEQFKIVDPFSYIKGEISRDDYISRFIPEYPALKYINNNLAPDAKIFFILLGKRGYYCDRDYIFDIGIMNDLINRAQKPENILKGLLNKKITHILINYHLFEKWMKDNFSEEEQGLTKDFFQKHANLVYFKNGFGVNVLIANGERIPQSH